MFVVADLCSKERSKLILKANPVANITYKCLVRVCSQGFWPLIYLQWSGYRAEFVRTVLHQWPTEIEVVLYTYAGVCKT